MLATAENLFHQIEQRANNVMDPPQVRLLTMCAVTRIAGELVYEKSLLWSANQKNCFAYFQKATGRSTDSGACYMVEFIVRPEVSIPLIIGVLLFAFAGRQICNILTDVVEFRPENFTLLEAGLMLCAVAEALGY
jgi:hypothetical protein